MDILSTPSSELISLILSSRLLITRELDNELKLFCATQSNQTALDTTLPKTYSQATVIELNALKKSLGKISSECITLSSEYDSLELPEGSLAYHRIVGTILSDSNWWFSTMQFERDMLSAEANPQFSGHFVHINSGGGDAYYLDQISKTLSACQKPIYVYIKKVCGSAAYYIGCHGTVVKATTSNDIIGCIGTMASFWDTDSYFEKLGLKKVEAYATRSILKNKKHNDLVSGKPKQFIEEDLNPLCEQFISEVQSNRKIISKLPDDHPILQGETYRAELAQSADNGLIDGIATLPEAIREAHDLGQQWLSNQQIKQQIRRML